MAARGSDGEDQESTRQRGHGRLAREVVARKVPAVPADPRPRPRIWTYFLAPALSATGVKSNLPGMKMNTVQLSDRHSSPCAPVAPPGWNQNVPGGFDLASA